MEFEWGKIAVVTSITGNYDCLRFQNPGIENIDYYCVTDDPNISDTAGWKVIRYEYPEYMNAKFKSFVARYNLLSMFNDYDYVIWLDASIELKPDFAEIMKKFIMRKFDFSVVLYNGDITYNMHLKMINYSFLKNLGHEMAFENAQIKKYMSERNWDMKSRSTENAAMRIYRNCDKCKWFNSLIYNDLIYLNRNYMAEPEKYGQMWHNFYYDELVCTYYMTLHSNMFKIFFLPDLVYNSDYMVKNVHGRQGTPCGDYKYQEKTSIRERRVFFGGKEIQNSL